MKFACSPQNDLYGLLKTTLENVVRCDSPLDAAQAAAAGEAVLVLADGYPDTPTPLTQEVYDAAWEKGLRLYVEFPSLLPAGPAAAPRDTQWERLVVASGAFGDELARLRLLQIHGCRFMPVASGKAHLVVARVAGLDTACYGLPKESFPVLCELDGVLVGTTKLSHFITGRYAPSEAWDTIWRWILRWLQPDAASPEFLWTPSVRPSFAEGDTFPENVERQAAERGIDWYRRARMLVHPSWEGAVALTRGANVELDLVVPEDGPVGDGSLGVIEGYSARIAQDGTQKRSLSLRSDCIAETAMAFAVAGRMTDSAESRRVGENLLDFLHLESVARKLERGNPDHPAYGLIAWGFPPPAWMVANYGDDNARVLLGTIAAAGVLETDRWDEAVAQCLLANLRTTGVNGFRGDRIDIPDLEENGWQYYHDRDILSFAPHFECYIWACYLWAYHHSGYEPFLECVLKAMPKMMAAYPNGLRWTNGLAQERARLLLPLAWLVRVQNTQEHRGWLRRVLEDIAELQAPCGAIREELGPPENGKYGPPVSNEAYGTRETPLIQENGDPVCDLLYTSNFALLGLREATAATGDPFSAQIENRLAQFLCRIQVRSEEHPELDGAWFRAFDFKRWEYWASSADAGWGAWAVETGWTQAWIAGVLAMRTLGTCVWDLASTTSIGKRVEEQARRFLPES